VEADLVAVERADQTLPDRGRATNARDHVAEIPRTGTGARAGEANRTLRLRRCGRVTTDPDARPEQEHFLGAQIGTWLVADRHRRSRRHRMLGARYEQERKPIENPESLDAAHRPSEKVPSR